MGESEALGGMQISPALLRYPSVPLPVFFNPFIPADWRRGGEHSCFPVGLSCIRGWGQGRGTSASVSAAVAAVALIRDWPSKPVSCIVHQRRSASQPESQMIPSTCKAFFFFFFLTFNLLFLTLCFNSASPTHL